MSAGKYSPAIVVAAYNRANSLQRLLNSIGRGVFSQAPITLVISIDRGENRDVANAAEAFKWPHGEILIIRHDQKLGLKDHILRCGDLTEKFGSIILLEDDLYVSPWFYGYASRCLDFYNDDEQVGGISLYSYDIAENGFNPFVPVDDGSDVYFMQVASSWGQAWSASQWQGFRKWFARHPEMTAEEKPPAYLFNWNENSWKKHFIRYLHFNDKFFVFPRHSLSTNFEELGATASTKGLYQVPVMGAQRDFKLIKSDESKSRYDACFEMRADSLKKWCPLLKAFDFTVDLYGTYPLSDCSTEYLLTTKKTKDAIFSFSLDMFPPVLNVIHDLHGEGIHLAKKESVTNEKVPADLNYYKLKPVSEIIFQQELVDRVEKVYAEYSEKINSIHHSYQEKTETLQAEIRQLHKKYHDQINALHDDYAIKLKLAVENALHDYQFKLDHPQFTIVTIARPDQLKSVVATAESIAQQDYPRINFKVIAAGSPDTESVESLTSMKHCSFVQVSSLTEALSLASDYLNHPESDFHCWLEPGAVLLPRALSTVKDLFKRFLEVNWLKGIPIQSSTSGQFTPMVKDMNIRWDRYRFQNASLREVADNVCSAVFWKRHLWQKAGGSFNPGYPHTASLELYNRFFSVDLLYVVMANLSARDGYIPHAASEDEFKKCTSRSARHSVKQRVLSQLGLPFYRMNIPLLRALHRSQHAYAPLIRFDFKSQSFYLSDY